MKITILLKNKRHHKHYFKKHIIKITIKKNKPAADNFFKTPNMSTFVINFFTPPPYLGPLFFDFASWNSKKGGRLE